MVEVGSAGAVPDVGFGAVEAVGKPVGGEEGLDEEAVFGGVGLEAVVVGGGEGGEIVEGFAGEEDGFGGDTEFEGVEAADGFAFGGARTGGFLGVGAIGGELFGCRHRASRDRG